AREMRAVHGRHIIPVPNIELKKQSFGYYVLGKIEDMVRWRTRRRKDDAAEKSVVRPAFSYYGKLDITDSAIEDMVRQIVENESDGWQLLRVQVHNAKSEEKSLKINVDLASVAGRRLDLAAGELQLSLKDRLEFMTGMIVNAVNARIVRILTAKE
ncbi:MAG: alkaline shock response membrane anchor protein AmaP, partial [Negativicutes bacterium]|nr:alkaline shock response membrane anchor protein AmaP [Negativicutes bacterium]